MSRKVPFTEEERIELLSNPFTARITSQSVIFTLAFKKYVLEQLERPGMNSKKIFEKAGYRDELVSKYARHKAIKRFLEEAASPDGLQEPKPIKQQRAKKSALKDDPELEALKKRVVVLEQQLRFLKKSQMLRTLDETPSSDNTS